MGNYTRLKTHTHVAAGHLERPFRSHVKASIPTAVDLCHRPARPDTSRQNAAWSTALTFRLKLPDAALRGTMWLSQSPLQTWLGA